MKFENLIYSFKEDDIIKYFDRVAYIDELDDEGMGLIHWMAMKGITSLVEALIIKKANINLVDKYGRTPILISLSNKNFNVFDYLMKNNAILDVADNDGMTALMYAVQIESEPIVTVLLQHVTNVNNKDNSGKTVVNWLVRKSDNVAIYKKLIESGADPMIADAIGINAFEAAQLMSRIKIIEEMKKSKTRNLD